MHDKRFAEEIKAVVSKKLAELDANSHITAINVRLSPISHVTPETLKGALAIVVSGSFLENIPLNIEKSQLDVTCRSCAASFSISTPTFSCRKCNSTDLDIQESPECFVESIETEQQ
ncbi:hydrogenase/urease maturation nickel metallochaperone HypA [Candidatus Omnitrophota bacterium]